LWVSLGCIDPHVRSLVWQVPSQAIFRLHLSFYHFSQPPRHQSAHHALISRFFRLCIVQDCQPRQLNCHVAQTTTAITMRNPMHPLSSRKGQASSIVSRTCSKFPLCQFSLPSPFSFSFCVSHSKFTSVCVILLPRIHCCSPSLLSSNTSIVRSSLLLKLLLSSLRSQQFRTANA
jgi:hypothetical protein